MYAGFLALSLLLSQAPVPCALTDSTVVCHCKQGFASSCDALAEVDAKAAETIRRATGTMKVAEEVEEKAKEELQKGKEESTDAVDTGCGGESPNDEDTKCTGQEHHIISKKVWGALEGHRALQGLYRYRDPRLVARAKDLKAHCGWQDWHRKIDAEIAKWVRDRPKLTPQEFEAYLREVFSRPELQVRFPNGF